jgi:glutaconate CoA-transferase subunit A
MDSDKMMTMKEAVSRFVGDGDTVYLAGFTHMIPFAAGHEIIRQGKKDLVLARATPT